MSRQNQWFVPGNDIAREVITADIQRYLGPDAIVRPGVGTGDYAGQPGYWITAYRTLTSQMIQDLRLDSQRWQAERQSEAGSGGSVAYQDSQTHAARQHWGPTTPYEQTQEPQPMRRSSAYDDRRDPKQPSMQSYTAYGYDASANYSVTPTSYPAQPQINYYSSPTTQESLGYEQSYAVPITYQSISSEQSGPYASANPGYYIASDGRQYPLSQQPQSDSRSPYMSQLGSTSSRSRSEAIPQQPSGMLGGSQDLAPNATTPSAPELFGRRSDNEGKGIAGMKGTYGGGRYPSRR